MGLDSIGGGGGHDDHDNEPDEPIDFTAHREERIQAKSEAELLAEIDARQRAVNDLIKGLDFDQAKCDVLQATFQELGAEHADKGIDQDTIDRISPKYMAALQSFADAMRDHAGGDASMADHALADARKDFQGAFDAYFKEIRQAHTTR